MRIGLSAYDIAAVELVALAAAADEAGFETLWLGEHLVLPLGYTSAHPTTGGAGHQTRRRPIIDPSTILVDPLVALGAMAATTEQIVLATGIYLLPLRHPLQIARSTLTVQDLAGGRFVLGAGSGWLREEFEALGVPFEERGSRLDETIDVLRLAWSGEVVEHAGRHFRFGPVRMTAEPVHVPIVLGGNTDRALQRAAARGDGWFSSGTLAFEQALVLRERLERFCGGAGRTAPLTQHYRTADFAPVDLERYAAEGFEHVVVWADRLWPIDGDLAQKRTVFMERAASIDRRWLGASA